MLFNKVLHFSKINHSFKKFIYKTKPRCRVSGIICFSECTYLPSTFVGGNILGPQGEEQRWGNIIKESLSFSFFLFCCSFSKLSVIFCSLWTPATSNKTAKYEWKTLKNYGLVMCVEAQATSTPEPNLSPQTQSRPQRLRLALHTGQTEESTGERTGERTWEREGRSTPCQTAHCGHKNMAIFNFSHVSS